MKVTASFSDTVCQVSLYPSDEWEQRLVGAVAKGGETLEAHVEYESVGHMSYEKARVVTVWLSATKGEAHE